MNISNKTTLILITFLFTITNHVYTNEKLSSPNFDIIMKEAALGDSMIFSGKGNLTYELIYVDSIKAESNYKPENKNKHIEGKLYPPFENYRESFVEFTFKGKKERKEIKYKRYLYDLENTKKIVNIHFLYAYNGEKTDMLIKNSIDEKITCLKGEIYPGHNPFTPLFFYSLTILGNSITSFLQGKINKREINNLNIIGEEILDNYQCNVFRGKLAESDTTITVWLSPKLKYRPKHIELAYKNGATFIDNTFNKHDKGFWMPKQTIIETYYFKNQEKILDTREIYTIHADAEFNIAVSDNIFEIEFPKGIRVADRRTKPFKIFKVE